MAATGVPTATDERAPSSPAKLGSRSWLGVSKRVVAQFRADNVTDMAATLTYYGILAIFPAVIALVSIVGLIGHSAIQPLINNLATLAPGTGRQLFTNAIKGLADAQGTAGVLFVVGLGGALWSASGYVGAFMRASNTIYGIAEARPVWKTIPLRVGMTLVLLVLIAVSAVAVVATGGLARAIGHLIGVGGSAVAVWDIAKWPVLLVVVSLMFSLLYWAAPNVKHPGLRWLSPGGLVAVVLWVIASGLFALYVANFSSYNKTYGALAGIVIFLVWLWISNIALLIGAEFNAEIEREAAIAAGAPEDADRFIEPRDAPD